MAGQGASALTKISRAIELLDNLRRLSADMTTDRQLGDITIEQYNELRELARLVRSAILEQLKTS